MMGPQQAYGGYAVGRVIGQRYRIEMVLAQRTASIMCLARDLTQPNVSVVIFSHPDRQLAQDVELLRHLFRDAQIVNVLNRDDLIQILDFNVEPYSGTLFLVLEHRAGLPANQLTALAGPENKTVAVFTEMARTLIDTHHSQDVYFDGPASGPRSSAHNPVMAQGPVPGPRSSAHNPVMDSPVPGPRSSAHNPLMPHGPPMAAQPMIPAQPAPAEARREAPRRPPPPKLTTVHIALITFVAVALSVGIYLAMQDPRQYYGPKGIQQSGYADDPQPSSSGRQGKRLMDEPAESQVITVTSNPSGAMLYKGMSRLGSTPMTVARPKTGQSVILRIKKDGYLEQSIVVTHMSPGLMTVMLGRGFTDPTRNAEDKPAPPPTNDLRRYPTYDTNPGPRDRSRPY